MSTLPQLLTAGSKLARQGDLTGARVTFEKAVRKFVNSAEAWINLSAIHGMQGNFHDALHCAHKGVELAPGSLQGWINLARAARSCGELGQAASACQRAHKLPGCPAEIYLEGGLLLAHLGKPGDAAPLLRSFLDHHPDHRDAAITLSKVLAHRGDIDGAIGVREEYSRRRPGDLPALLELGSIYIESGKLREAWRICEQALRAEPDNTSALLFKATLLMHERRPSEARDIFERLDRMNPGTPQILMQLSQVCRELSDMEASIAYNKAALEYDPCNIPALLSLSSAMMYRDTAESWKLLEQAMAIAPDEPATLVLKAELLEFGGKKLEAWNCVQSAIERGYTDTRAINVAASVAPAIGKSEEAIARLEKHARQPGISASNRSIVHFTLASLCDKIGDYDRAFEHAIIANRLKNVRHDDNAHLVQINRLMAVYGASCIDSLPRSGIASDLPIFIVGMPRSGTSLVEQILSCHSQVKARGETTDIPSITGSIPYYPDGVRNLSREKLDALAQAHLQHISESAPEALRITDKLPGNFLFLGIIWQLFPGARVVNCRRDPRDVCLSNFMTDFGGGHEHSYHLESLARVCKSYQDLMTHWRHVLPMPILDVRYEELVAEPRTQVERILGFCGLDWEDACLSFHMSSRQVLTASYDQVRQPLYTRSIARWKHYERHLEPVSRILGLHDDTYP